MLGAIHELPTGLYTNTDSNTIYEKTRINNCSCE
jgi:hypothetical protein